MGIKVSIFAFLITPEKSYIAFTTNQESLSEQGEDDEAEVSKPLNDDGIKTLQKQEEMFRNLDVQYEMARSQTHTQRGMGLGFSSSFSRGMDSV